MSEPFGDARSSAATGRPDPRWRAALVWVGGGCAASLLSILFLDRSAATWSHAVLHGATVFRALTHIVDPVPPVAAIGFLGLGTAALSGRCRSPLLRALLCASVAALVAIMIKDELKFAFGRLWPETWVNDNPSWIRDGAYGFAPFHGGAGWSSFPSGHMTAVTAPAAVFWRRYPAWRALAGLPVALVALGLYGADFHFVGDMIAGTTLGAVCAVLATAVVPDRDPRED